MSNLTDVNIMTGDEIVDTYELIKQVVSIILITPYESRVFNPAVGTRVYQLLQEPSNHIYELVSKRDLVISAIERSLPEVTVIAKLSTVSSGRGVSSTKVSLELEYQGEDHLLEFEVSGRSN